jgi:hypothetical protein
MSKPSHAYIQLLDEKLGSIRDGAYASSDTGLEKLVGGGAVDLEVV